MAKKTPRPLIEAGRQLLQELWEDPQRSADCPIAIPDAVSEAIDRCINSATLTYRYVLPTQLLAKAIDPALDCRAIQAGASLPGAFDARSLCHSVIVEFDRQNHSVLGGSKEPYLNNPLRIQAITSKYRAAQKDKSGFDDLRTVLEFAEGNSGVAANLLQRTLTSIRRRLTAVSIVYPVPNRASLKQAQCVLADFLGQRSGGTRMQTVAVALFQTIGHSFRIFSEVRSGNVNAADSQTGIAADLECVSDSGTVALVVEVKDRVLTLRQLQDKLPVMREKGIREIIFLVQGGVDPENEAAVADTIDRQFVTGQNVYVCEFAEFVQACLVLFGEEGRRIFLIRIGEELDRLRADLSHRQAWCELLQAL